jgi:hypothetical protein
MGCAIGRQLMFDSVKPGGNSTGRMNMHGINRLTLDCNSGGQVAAESKCGSARRQVSPAISRAAYRRQMEETQCGRPSG